MVSDTVVVAAIVAVSSTCAPLFLAYLTAQQRRKERREDFERQDKVAQRAAIVAKNLMDFNRSIVSAADDVGMNLDGQMRESLRSEIEAIERQLALAQEVLQLRIEAGNEPSDDSLRAIRFTKDRLEMLKAQLAAREQKEKETTQVDPDNDLGSNK